MAVAQTGATNHEWSMTLKVVDEAGNPVAGAKAAVSYFSNSEPAAIGGITDTNGILAAEHSVGPSYGGYELGFAANKPGYYSVKQVQLLGPTYDPVKWNQTITLILKKVGRPISMYAKKVETKTPAENQPVGFDLVVGDWVLPYGTGQSADLFFTVHRNVVSANQYDATVTLTFPNKTDGIAIVHTIPEVGSAFKGPRTASDSGYETNRVWHYGNSQQPKSVFGYFVRVRTVADENGNVKSALYGKIVGDLRFYVGTKAPQSGIGFTYYLNPTPNDRDVEFDPGRNLLNSKFGDLPVSEP